MSFLEILKAIFLGIIEGITEWLPISSTGHMLLFDEFFQLKQSSEFKEMFFVVVQLGAILAVVILFWKKIFPFSFKEKPIIQKDKITMWIKIAVSCVPAAIIGVLFDDKIYVQEDRGNKDTKLQYKIEIEFCQIEKIDMTTTSNNSLNHYMRFVITPMPYIVLHLADNREKRINVYYYSNKQTIEIIDYIIAKKKLTNPSFINKSGIELTSTLKKKSSFT